MQYLCIGSGALLERVTIKQNWSEKEEKTKTLRLMCAALLIQCMRTRNEILARYGERHRRSFLFIVSPSRYNSINDWI